MKSHHIIPADRENLNDILVITTHNPIKKRSYTYHFEIHENNQVKINKKSKSFYSRTNSRMIQKYEKPSKNDVPQSIRKYLRKNEYELIK